MNHMVSIACITYNHERYIKQAIDSFLMQKTSFYYEIVIGEDCSADRTREIVSQYQRQYPEIIRIIPSTTNIGMSRNFVKTLGACNGKYIAICEGDDYWTDPYKLQKQVDFLEANSEYGLVHTGFEAHDSEDRFIGIKEPDNWTGHIFFAMQKRPIVSTLTSVVRQEALKPLINRIKAENLNFIIDIWLWQQIALKWKIYYLPDITAVYRVHPGGITKRKNGLGNIGGFITLDIFNTFFNESKMPISFMNKLVMANKFCLAYLSILRHEKGNRYRDIAKDILSKHPWLIIGLIPAVLGKLLRLPKQLFARLYGA